MTNIMTTELIKYQSNMNDSYGTLNRDFLKDICRAIYENGGNILIKNEECTNDEEVYLIGKNKIKVKVNNQGIFFELEDPNKKLEYIREIDEEILY